MSAPKSPFGSSGPDLNSGLFDNVHSNGMNPNSDINPLGPQLPMSHSHSHVRPEGTGLGFGKSFGEQSFNGHPLHSGVIDKW